MNFSTRLLLLVISPLFLTQSLPAESAPNIVLILADDMGYGDIGAYHSESKIPTPHLDQLAAEGIRFTDAHAGGSSCKPSRYSLLSGTFACRAANLNDRKGPMLPEGRATLASILRDNGYHTAMVGKWHLGFDQKGRKEGEPIDGFAFDYGQPITGGPRDRGFDSYFGMHASLDIPPYFFIRDRMPTMVPTDTIEASTSVGGEEGWDQVQGAFWRDGAIAPDFKHVEVSPRFAQEAAQVIETHRGEKPLFLYLALPSPHTPWLPTEEFTGKSGAGMYGDFAMMVDSLVGQVLSSLDAADMRENTLVLFSSDNGPVWYAKDEELFGHRATGPLRGVKGSAWEGGHRMPFLLRWPKKIPAGTQSNHLVAFADVFATFAELAGQTNLPESMAEDSVSFAPILFDPGGDHPLRAPILHGEKVIRDGDWKLLNTKGSRGRTADPNVKYGIALYHLEKDLGEETNLADSMPEKVEELRGKIRSLLGDKP